METEKVRSLPLSFRKTFDRTDNGCVYESLRSFSTRCFLMPTMEGLLILLNRLRPLVGSKRSGTDKLLTSPTLLLVRPPRHHGQQPLTLCNVISEWFVNPEDTALLHLAAATFPTLVDSRIWAVSSTFTWNEILALLRKIDPTRSQIPSDLPDGGKDLSTIDNSRGTEILLALGRKGWMGLEESLRENVEGLP